jgi:hypothetical protein
MIDDYKVRIGVGAAHERVRPRQTNHRAYSMCVRAIRNRISRGVSGYVTFINYKNILKNK